MQSLNIICLVGLNKLSDLHNMANNCVYMRYIQLQYILLSSTGLHIENPFLCFMDEFIHGMAILDFFQITLVNLIHDHGTRQAKSKNLYVSFRPTSRGQKSFTFSGPLVWNFSISKMNPNCTIGSFKKLLRQILQLCSIADLPWWLCFSWLWLPNCCSLKSYNRHLYFIIISNMVMQWCIVSVTCTAPCLQVQILNRY